MMKGGDATFFYVFFSPLRQSPCRKKNRGFFGAIVLTETLVRPCLTTIFNFKSE